MKFRQLFGGILALAIATSGFAQTIVSEKCSALSNAVILIIRHAEKPESGPGLTAEGEARAQAYVTYFTNFKLNGQPLKPDYQFAAADSRESRRSRLTLEPTAKALGLTIDSRFKNKSTQELANEIRSKPHGKVILIAWHHGEIPELLRAFGANPKNVLRKGKWPDAEYGWLIQLRYDADGKLVETQRIIENLPLAQTNKPAPAVP
jgi:hypothetical protein